MPDRQQILEREMQADAEHQQDHADFRQFIRQPCIRDKAGRERTHQNARDQISDKWRKFHEELDVDELLFFGALKVILQLHPEDPEFRRLGFILPTQCSHQAQTQYTTCVAWGYYAVVLFLSVSCS